MTESNSSLQEALANLSLCIQACSPGTSENVPPLCQALESFGNLAGENNQLGLQDCSLLLQQQLQDIANNGGLTEDQCVRLSDFPVLLESYLAEHSPEHSNALLAILKADCWPAPLADEDADILRDMLYPMATAMTSMDTPKLKDTLTAIYTALPEPQSEAPVLLDATAEQLGNFALSAADAGQLALQDCALLLQQNLNDISASNQDLSDAQRTLLVAWLNLATKYLAEPDDKTRAEALVRNLQSHNWPVPLSSADALIFYELFGVEPPEESEEETAQPAPAASPGPAAVIDEPADLALFINLLADITTTDADLGHDMAARLGDIALAAADCELLGLQDVCLLLQQQLQDVIAEQGHLNDAQINQLKRWGEHARLYFAEPHDRTHAEALVQDLAADCWPNPASEADNEILLEMLLDIPATAADGLSVPTEIETIAPDRDVSIQAIPADQLSTPEPRAISKDLVDMLVAEINQMQADAQTLITQLEATDATTALRSDALAQYAVRIERFGNASQAAELSGLQQACDVLQRNIYILAQGQDQPTPQQATHLHEWPAHIGIYLDKLGDRAAGRTLVDALLDTAWPEPLLPELGEPLIDLLSAAYITEHAERESRLTTATPEHVNLALPTDINQELLDGLLQELPGQTESFSEAIQALASGHGSAQDLQRAQRVAHTIKGAANTVGVRGIATLTHQIEDLLVILVEHNRMPSRILADTLIEAADCLEEMCEALIEQQPAPDGAIETLQAVLDWVNRIEAEGIDVLEADITPTRPETAAPAAATAEQTEAEEEQAQAATLRVPASLIDDLLRLVGETVILTAQLQEQVRQTTSQNESLLNQHDLLQHLVGDLEQQVDVSGIASKHGTMHADAATNEAGFDTLELEQYNELHTITHRLVEAATDSIELDQDIGQYLHTLDELLINQSRLQREVQELVMRTRMVPIKTIVPRLQRAVRQTCRTTGKQADLALHGTDTLLDSDILSSLVDPLMHILRNAVDHGIENREERIRNNKSPTGNITLECFREGIQIVIRCIDDGGGLDLDAIRQLGEQRGLIDHHTELSEEELKRLILRPGFSTRKQTTQTSGRGIGMDIVATQLQNIKGSILIDSQPGQGTQFELRLPVSLMTTHGLLVRVRKQIMAISTRGIEQILHPSDGEIIERNEKQHYVLDDETLDFYHIDDLLRLPKDRRTEQRQNMPSLLIREEALNCTVQIEQIIDTRDLVVKPLGPYLQKIRGIVGATILGDGSVVPVLDLPELIRMPADAGPVPGELTDTGIRRSLPVALVVDDSISARRTLAQIIRDAGYEVRTAKDGLEAATIIEKRCPDILLTDLEMPRMNGIELTSHVRGNPASADLPVIMITSRSTDKHRQLAESAGVDVYLTKPFSEDQLLQHVHDLLEHAYSTTI